MSETSMNIGDFYDLALFNYINPSALIAPIFALNRHQRHQVAIRGKRRSLPGQNFSLLQFEIQGNATRGLLSWASFLDSEGPRMAVDRSFDSLGCTSTSLYPTIRPESRLRIHRSLFRRLRRRILARRLLPLLHPLLLLCVALLHLLGLLLVALFDLLPSCFIGILLR
jgi:hypothetical protein